jgi:hypothetical protein
MAKKAAPKASASMKKAPAKAAPKKKGCSCDKKHKY